MENQFNYKGNFLKEYHGFIYEVEIYKKTNDSWNLEDTSMYKSNKFIEGLVAFSISRYMGYELHKFTELIAAPSFWLKENCELIPFETGKEKRKRIKNEKDKLKEFKDNQILQTENL